MATTNRAALINKTLKVLKKHYKPHTLDMTRPVLEQFLFACCLENSHYEAAEAAFTSLKSSFFDWNEVRVSSVNEIAEAVSKLPDPSRTALQLRRLLQSVFEATYSFDLEVLKKQNLGQAVQRLQKFHGATPFSVACVTQHTLGGHAIPVSQGTLEALAVVGLVNEANIKEGSVPGLERAVPKNKGLEVASLLHQLGADFIANRYSTDVQKILLEISPDAKAQLPRRHSKKAPAEADGEAPATGAAEESPDAEADSAGAGHPRKKSSTAKNPAPAAKKSADKSDDEPSGARKKSSAATGSKRKPR
jgi:endonuclease III